MDDESHFFNTTKRFVPPVPKTAYHLVSYFTQDVQGNCCMGAIQDLEKFAYLKAASVKFNDDNSLGIHVGTRRVDLLNENSVLRLSESIDLESTYSTIFRKLYEDDPSNCESIVTDCISKFNLPQSEIEKLTFEYSLSHFAHEFNSNVDYIWQIAFLAVCWLISFKQV